MAGALPPSAAEWIATGSHLATPGGRIFYRTQGEGPALVMLHGFPTWSYDWAQVTPDLARDHQVVTLDFAGYGASEKRMGVDFSVSASADAVESLLRHLAIFRATLVIHAMAQLLVRSCSTAARRGAYHSRLTRSTC